jgi:fluoride exporter
MIALLVALAGGLGAVSRFLVDGLVDSISRRASVPLGTLVINVSGSFLLGLVTGWWAAHTGDPGLRLVLGTGFLGGYTTFSTASVEAARLATSGRGWPATAQAAGMVVLSVSLAALGMWLGGL